MIKLKDLLEDGEVLVQYHLCNEYWSRNAITVKGNDDIGSALEMTLHRILEAGGSKTYKEHLDKPLEQRGTVAAFRDINRWKDCSEKVTWDEVKPKEAEYLADVFGQEFTYIFDVEETRWYFAYWGDDNRLRDLEKTLHSKKLLEKLFGNMYIKDYFTGILQ